MIAVAQEISDPSGLHERLSEPDPPRSELRRTISGLSHVLASAVRQTIGQEAGAEPTILCAVILRGGLLLYPGFCAEFSEADFCLLGMHRNEPNSVDCHYKTEPGRANYDAAVLIDCVAATGGTIQAARGVLRESCRIPYHLAAVICSTSRGTEALTTAGINVTGFSLTETSSDGMVIPDLGKKDAGDVFSGRNRLEHLVS